MTKVNIKEIQNNQIINLTLLLKEKEQEVRIAKQKVGFFARKCAEKQSIIREKSLEKSKLKNSE